MMYDYWTDRQTKLEQSEQHSGSIPRNAHVACET